MRHSWILAVALAGLAQSSSAQCPDPLHMLNAPPALVAPPDPQTPAEYFDRSNALMNLRVTGGRPFHLIAQFEALGPAEVKGQGKYEEWWKSPRLWRREVTLGEIHFIETLDEDQFYVSRNSAYTPRRIDEVLDAIYVAAQFTHWQYYPADWKMSRVTFNGAGAVRIVRGYVQPEGNLDPRAAGYYIDPVSGSLLGMYCNFQLVTYADLTDFAGKRIPRAIEVSEAGAPIVRLRITLIETPESFPTELFSLRGVEPTDFDPEETQGITEPRPIHKVNPAYPLELRGAQVRGTVKLDIEIDRHGHVRSVSVKQSVHPLLDEAATRAAWQWEFVPGVLNGRPVGLPIHWEFVFK